MDDTRFDRYEGKAKQPVMPVGAFFIALRSYAGILRSFSDFPLPHPSSTLSSSLSKPSGSFSASFCPSNRVIRKIFMLVCLLAAMADGAAQGWNMHWIECPGAQTDEQIWFRRTFTDCGETESATIEVASGGHFVLYVNGYNVTTDKPVHIGSHSPDIVFMMKYEVDRFLRNDTNVIAVWYSPCTDNADGKRQLSLSFYGRRSKGTAHDARNGCRNGFAHVSDDSWLCRTNGCRTSTDGAETVDGRIYTPLWNMEGGETMLWQRAVKAEDSCRYTVEELPPMRPVCRITDIRQCVSETSQPQDITFRSQMPFIGQVRATLRGMNRGDIVSIGSLDYICSGTTDEQACRRFTVTADTETVISGKRLKRENIMNVEALQLKTCFHMGWMY